MGVTLTQQRQRIFYNVLDFAGGLVPDGNTNFDTVISAAFSAASGASGSEVHFPDGIYLVSIEHDVPSNCVVSGNGYNSVIRRQTGSVSYLVNVLRINSKNNVRITNLQIDGQKADIITNYNSTAQDGSHIYKTCCGVYVTGTAVAPSTNITVDHCWIHDAYYGNIQPDAVDGMNIESNYLYNGRDNQINGRVNASGSGGTCSHITVRGNVVTGAGPQTTATQYSGIQFIRGTYITITGNICQNLGNTISTEGDGIGLEGCRHVTISNNVCTHNLSQGIKVDRTVEGSPAAWDALDAYVPNDAVSYLGNNFISLTYNNNSTPPSTATSNSNWSYQASGPYTQISNDVTIVGNVCSDNNYFATYALSGTGLFVQYADNVVVDGNTFSGNYVGITQGRNVTSLTIKNNSTYNNQSAGMTFYNNTNATGPFVIEDNYVARNGAKGIDVVVPCTIRGNTVQRNAQVGISINITGTVVQANPFFLIADNILADNGDSGILVAGGFASAVPVEIRGNYAPKSTIQPRFLGENGTPVRCVNNRVDTQNVELWYFTSASSVWIDENNRQIASVTANYNVGINDNVVLVAPASATTITLPAPNATHPSANPGRSITISKTSTSVNTVTVATAGGAINGPLMVGNLSSQTYVSDGTNWNVVSSAAPVPWVLMAGDPSAYGGNAATANTAYFVGVTLQAAATLTGLRVRFNSVGGSGHYDVGIYDYAGNLLAHSGSTATASGAPLTYTLGTPLKLAPGNYWMAFWIDNATDQPFSRVANTQGVDVIQSVSASSNLPATNSGAANAIYKPWIAGLLQGGWS
jgi:parallel beta helix pectate lyase-like protein